MLLGNDLLELIGMLDDPESRSRAEDADDAKDVATPSEGDAPSC